jgi:hypothetical protein
LLPVRCLELYTNAQLSFGDVGMKDADQDLHEYFLLCNWRSLAIPHIDPTGALISQA